MRALPAPGVEALPRARRARPSDGPCERCGATHSVRPLGRVGRTAPFRTIPALPLPADFALPTCARCGTEYLDAELRAALRSLLSRLYAAELRRRAALAVSSLSSVTSQRRIERLLGLSQGYLSRLKAGAGTPSPALVVQLQQLALDPLPRLRELERLWGEPLPT